MKKYIYVIMLAFICGIAQEVKAYYDDDGNCVREIDDYMADDMETISVDGFYWASPGYFVGWTKGKDFVMKIKGTINIYDLTQL